MRRGELIALGGLAFILAVTAAWWALALWPVAGGGPEWLVRTRAVCFGVRPDGLPDPGGWAVLLGQPLSMAGTLFLVWPEASIGGIRRLWAHALGRWGLRLVSLLLLLGLGGAAFRVSGALAAARAVASLPAPTGAYPRLDEDAPPLDLVDQHGERVTLERFRGRPVLVTFAYGHCETVCPLIVRDVVEASRLASELDPAVLVVTLDPWRDTPARLPSIAAAWRLPEGAGVLGGTLAEVEAALDDWKVARSRDERTGEITHIALVYVIDAAGRLAYMASGGAETIAGLVRKL